MFKYLTEPFANVPDRVRVLSGSHLIRNRNSGIHFISTLHSRDVDRCSIKAIVLYSSQCFHGTVQRIAEQFDQPCQARRTRSPNGRV